MAFNPYDSALRRSRQVLQEFPDADLVKSRTIKNHRPPLTRTNSLYNSKDQLPILQRVLSRRRLCVNACANVHSKAIKLPPMMFVTSDSSLPKSHTCHACTMYWNLLPMITAIYGPSFLNSPYYKSNWEEKFEIVRAIELNRHAEWLANLRELSLTPSKFCLSMGTAKFPQS